MGDILKDFGDSMLYCVKAYNKQWKSKNDNQYYRFSKTYKQIEKEKYLLPSALITKEDLKDTEYKTQLNIDLRNDKSYHLRLYSDDECIAFGDIDKCETEELLNTIIDAIKYLFGITFITNNDFSYTISQNDEGLWGSHWTIPTIKTNFYTLKKKLTEFKNKMTYGEHIDTGIYKDSFFRLPYQTNEDKKHIHKISNGKPIDFLIHNIQSTIPKNDLYIEKDKVKDFFDDNDDKTDLIIVNVNYPLLNILESHFDSYSDWSRMCWIMKSLKYEFSVFDEYSKKYPKKYNKNDCLKFWNKCKTSKVNEGILYGLAKRENPDEFEKLNLNYSYKEDIIPVQTIEMTEKEINKNKGYLIHSDNINLDFKDCLISNKLNDFFTIDNIKSFNIKSPYDTGKTQLLTKILTKYPQKRVLFLSYRKTLTSDLIASFKTFGFKDYRDVICNETDKLIIQLESINKIKPSFLLVDEESDIPTFDLIIIDELESILQQYNSDTFKGESKDAFEFISAIINNSKKLITLDGDLSYRGFNYINHFGDSINIINPVKKNKKIFTLIDSENTFHDNIIESLNNKEKIVIVSQTSNKCINMYAFIKKKFPKLKMSIYTGSSSDLNKKDLDDVINNWSLLDVLIYSPTIEAGVNFDVLHFDKIYGIVSSGCNSQRAFCQMLARVRKTTDNNILLYASSLQYKKLSKNNIYSFDEVQNTLVGLNIIKIDETYEGSKIVKKLTPYNINYIYNKIEELMKHKYYYLGYLELLLKNKGHDFINEIKPKEKGEKSEQTHPDIKESKLASSEKFLTIDDITEDKFKRLMDRQKTSTATETDKLQIKKYLIKSSLGLDKIDNELLEKYDSPYIIKKIEYLIDISNIPKYNDNQTIEYTKKTEIINDLITKLGFKLFENKRVSREDFEEKTKEIVLTNEIFTNPKQAKILFNSSKVDIKTNRQFLGFINTILENYKLKIFSHDIKVKKKDIEKLGKTNTTEYTLGFLPGYENINEFLQYKIDKGYKLIDTNNIRPKATTEKYKHLILSEEQRIKYYEELKEIEYDNDFEEYKKENNIKPKGKVTVIYDSDDSNTLQGSARENNSDDDSEEEISEEEQINNYKLETFYETLPDKYKKFNLFHYLTYSINNYSDINKIALPKKWNKDEINEFFTITYDFNDLNELNLRFKVDDAIKIIEDLKIPMEFLINDYNKTIDHMLELQEKECRRIHNKSLDKVIIGRYNKYKL